MSFTYDGVRAEVEYRRDERLAGAKHSRLRRSARQWAKRNSSLPGPTTMGKVRDGTTLNGYDLAA